MTTLSSPWCRGEKTLIAGIPVAPTAPRMTRAARWRLLIAAGALAGVVAIPALARGQNGAFVELSTDLSQVTSGGADTTWQVARLVGGRQVDGQFGWLFAAERHERGGRVDWAGEARGFRRRAPWTLSGAVGAAADPKFYYRRSLEGELARDIGGGLVVHGGYRHLQFPVSSVHVVQPALSWSGGPHDLQARGYLVRNTTTDQDALTVLVRGTLQASPRVRVGAGAAIGSRIFDVTAAESTDARGWVVFGYTQVLVTPHMLIVGGAGGAHEDPLFDQRTLSLGARWIF
jgi:YaiO family outer membrane protein